MGEEAASCARNGGNWRPFGAVLMFSLKMVELGIRCRGRLCKSRGWSATGRQEEARGVVNVPGKRVDSTLQVQSHEADRASSLHPSSSTTP